LPHDYVECLFEDREGSLWIGTRGGGLVQMEDANVTGFTSRHGLASDLTKCVMQASDGSIWVGTEGGGVSCLRNGEFRNYTMRDGLPSDFIYALAEGPSGVIWLGSAHPAALVRFEDGRFKTYSGRHGFRVDHQVRAIHVDKDGSVWTGGEEGGVSHLKGGKFVTYTVQDGLPSDLVRTIFHDRAGRLWVATGGGLCWFENGRFEVCPGQDGLVDKIVYCALEDPAGTIWLGTQHGLGAYREGRFRSYALEKDLAGGVISQVLQDRAGTLWLSSSRGIFSISPRAVSEFESGRSKRVVLVPYGVADGMKSTHCEGGSQPAGCRDDAGRLWFPTATGVAIIDPNLVERKQDPGPCGLKR
jgi:ligand-binding sensor domain-containing protein